MIDLKPNTQRANLIIIFIWIYFALRLTSIISLFYQHNLITSIENGDGISYQTAHLNDLIQKLIAYTSIAIYLSCGFVFILWFRRAYYNLHQKFDYLSYAEGWAAGAWFVPFINFYYPFQIMKELYSGTDYLLHEKDETHPQKTSQFMVVLWWILWIVSNILGQIIYRIYKNPLDLEELSRATNWSMVGAFFSLVLSVVTIKVIKDYSEKETLFYQAYSESETITSMELLPVTETQKSDIE